MSRNSFVTKIDLSLADRIREDLIDQGFELSTPPYTLFSGKKPGVSCTLYTSGKLMIQGKNMEEFITFYIEPEILKDLSFSHPETLVETTAHIGIDEAGKGDFFGPLCIAGVYADEAGIKQLLSMGVRDSKRMRDAALIPLAAEIRNAFPHSIIALFPEKYNELYDRFNNLNRLLAWGHATAIAELVEKSGCKKATIDQFGGPHLVENALSQKNLRIDLTQRHYGEEDPVVAAASILARASFVEGIDRLSKRMGLTLPKGASQLVVDAGRRLVQKQGPEALAACAKLHFKTKEMVLRNA